MQEIRFGMLQAAKTNEIKAKHAGVTGAQIGKAENIFAEYQKYKNMLEESEGASGLSTNESNMELSPADLEAMINETVGEFNEYYAIINETATPNQENTEEDKDEKEKIKPSQFNNLMA